MLETIALTNVTGHCIVCNKEHILKSVMFSRGLLIQRKVGKTIPLNAIGDTIPKLGQTICDDCRASLRKRNLVIILGVTNTVEELPTLLLADAKLHGLAIGMRRDTFGTYFPKYLNKDVEYAFMPMEYLTKLKALEERGKL